VDVMLDNTASAMEEGRSPCPLVALPVEMVRSFTLNFARSIISDGGLWSRNRSLLFSDDFPGMGSKALLLLPP